MMEPIINYLSGIVSMPKLGIDVNFIRYARTQFPGMSDALIRKNLCEIIAAYDADYKCKSCCMGIDMCPELLNTAGYTYRMILQHSGWIKTEYVPCVFNGGKEFGRTKKVGKFTQVGIFG